MKLTWYGHASFLIVANDGTRIVTDPYTPQTSGYLPISNHAGIVIISSENDSFHCRADLVPGNPTVINALALAEEGGQTVESGIPIRAIAAMEALSHREHDPDQNGMYRFEVDGVHVGHMGDMGNALSPDQLAFFEGIDVLLALAGGHPTIELDDLMTLIDHVSPRIVVPMHFRTLKYRPRNTYWIDTFMGYFADADIDFPCVTEVEISRESLPEKTRIWVLPHAG